MYHHRNWREEMVQIGRCNKNRSRSRSSEKLPSIKMISWKGMRMRNKGGGGASRRRCEQLLVSLILSLCSSVAVMAYQNDLSSSKSGAALRSGCVWSRTDSNGGGVASTVTTPILSTPNYMNGMSGNNLFRHPQPQHSFPILSSSSSSSSSLYSSSLLTSGPGSASTFGAGSGVLTLDCNVRTLNAPDLHNQTGSLSREQVEQARVARLKCNDKLFFESLLSSNQTLFQLRNLRRVQIDSCKIRKLTKGLFSAWSQLKQLHIKTDNGLWSPAVSLEIETNAFEGLGQVESLDLTHNNIWAFPDLCPLRSLLKLNISHNLLSDPEELGGGSCMLNIQSLDVSSNKIRHIRNTFKRLRKLAELRLQNNLIEEIQDNAFEGLTLKLVDLSSNRIVALPRIFGPTLREINVSNNSLTALSPQLFSGLDQLLLLDLSRNSLTTQWVSESIFAGLVRLVVLKLSHNKLTSVDSAVFKDLISAQAIFLDNNEIESISPGAFENMRNLHILDLSNNKLATLGDGKLFSNLFVLRQLYLDHNKLAFMHPDVLKNCTDLQDLGLADNALGPEIPVAIRNAGLRHLKTLDIGQNRISVVRPFEGLSQLYGLRMVANRLTELPTGFCNSLKNLRVLNVAQNRISKIFPTAFSGCPEIRALRLDSNSLETLPPTLAQLPSLLWVNVSVNRLSRVDYATLPPSVEWLDLSHQSIKELVGARNGSAVPSLRVLDVSYNQLQRLDSSHIPRLLDTLRVNYNQLTALAPDTFKAATRLRRVEMVGNQQLKSIPLTALRLSPVPLEKALPEFYLAGTFLCDCSMEWLTPTRLNQLAVLRQYPRIVDLDKINCNFPRANQIPAPLIETKAPNFLCPYKSHCFSTCECCEFDACDCEMNCPDGCSCWNDPSWSVNVVECSNLNFSQIPPQIPMDVSELYLDGNYFPALGNHIFIGKKNLRVIYLNGSSIRTIKSGKTFNGLKSLEVMHLENNLLEEIGELELESLRELYLQNNYLQTVPSFDRLKFLRVLRLDGNLLTNFQPFELGKTNTFLNSLMLSGNPWQCDCDLIRWITSLRHLVVDFALVKCLQQDSKNTSTAANNNGTRSVSTGASGTAITHPTISSMCAFNYSPESPAAASSSSSSNGGSNHVLLMNNHISSLGGAVRNNENPGSLQLSSGAPYHHAHLEKQGGNFPQNENIIATTAAPAGGGGLRSKTNHAGRSRVTNDDGASGNSSFFPILVTFIAVILVACFGCLVALVTFRKREQLSGMRWRWCLNKAAHSSSANEDLGAGSGSDMDYYYFSDQEKEKLFDAYFIYSQKDEDFVREKLAGDLERGGDGGCDISYYSATQQHSSGKKLRFCLHYRDLCLALDNPWNTEMILSACNASRRVVLLISNNFLNNEWTNHQFRVSVQSAIQQQQHYKKLIAIKLPPVSDQTFSSVCQGFQSLQQSINNPSGGHGKQSCFAIKWEDKDFRSKFRLLLPAPLNANAATLGSANLPYTTSLNHNFVSAAAINHGPVLPYQIPMHSSPRNHHYHQPSLMNWQQQQQSGSLAPPLGCSVSSVHPCPSQLTPQHFGYSNIDGFQNRINSQQNLLFPNRQSQRQQLNNTPLPPHQPPRSGHHNNNPTDHHGPHIHSLSQMTNIMASSKSPTDVNYSSSAVSSGNEEFDHVYSTLDSPLESPCSDLGPGHVAGNFAGAMMSGAQVNRHQIQHSTSSGISSGSDATSGTGGCHPAMYFV